MGEEAGFIWIQWWPGCNFIPQKFQAETRTCFFSGANVCMCCECLFCLRQLQCMLFLLFVLLFMFIFGWREEVGADVGCLL